MIARAESTAVSLMPIRTSNSTECPISCSPIVATPRRPRSGASVIPTSSAAVKLIPNEKSKLSLIVVKNRGILIQKSMLTVTRISTPTAP